MLAPRPPPFWNPKAPWHAQRDTVCHQPIWVSETSSVALDKLLNSSVLLPSLPDENSRTAGDGGQEALRIIVAQNVIVSVIFLLVPESSSKPLLCRLQGSTPGRLHSSQPPPASPAWSRFEAVTHSTALQLPSITCRSPPLCVSFMGFFNSHVQGPLGTSPTGRVGLGLAGTEQGKAHGQRWVQVSDPPGCPHLSS